MKKSQKSLISLEIFVNAGKFPFFYEDGALHAAFYDITFLDSPLRTIKRTVVRRS